MSFQQKIRSKSPTSKPMRLMSPKYVLKSPEGLKSTNSNSSNLISYTHRRLKQQTTWQSAIGVKSKPNLTSPIKSHLYSSNTSTSSRSDIRLKLESCRQKISQIQELLNEQKQMKKERGQGQQRIKKHSGDGGILEKIHYKSVKTTMSSSSGAKSLLTNTSSQEASPDGTYKWLQFNGQQEIFRVLRFINQGCFGKVHLVQHVATNFICCLKTIAKQDLNQSLKQQITREILIQSYITHPNIVAIYGHCHDEQNVYLLLQACLGGNLFEKLKNEGAGLPEKEVAYTVKEVCRALQFMHNQDIMHRDIKPQNILLHEGTVKICDFGWAVHSPLLRNTRCGTPVYLSPEVLRYDLYDSKVDVWSIGVLAYELLFGKIPFEIKCIEDLSKIVFEDIVFEGKKVSDDAKEFIMRCLSKHPRDRLTMKQALDHSFLQRERYRQTIN